MLADGTVYRLATERDGEASTVLTMEELQTSRQQFLADHYSAAISGFLDMAALSGIRLSILKNAVMASFLAFINAFVYGPALGVAARKRPALYWHWIMAGL